MHSRTRYRVWDQRSGSKQVTSNNMTGKPKPFSDRCRSISGENRDTSQHRSPKKSSYTNCKRYYGNNNLKPRSRSRSSSKIFTKFSKTTKFSKKPNYNNNNMYSNNSRPQSPNYNRDGKGSRRPVFTQSLQQAVYETILTHSFTRKKRTTQCLTQNVSEGQLSEEQFNYLILELNHDKINILIARKNVIILPKNTFFLHRVKRIFGFYHSQCIHNRHLTIQKQFLHQVLKMTF